MSEHGEPWFWNETFQRISDEFNELVAEYEDTSIETDVAHRIIECVNACEGLENPEDYDLSALPELVEAVEDIATEGLMMNPPSSGNKLREKKLLEALTALKGEEDGDE